MKQMLEQMVTCGIDVEKKSMQQLTILLQESIYDQESDETSVIEYHCKLYHSLLVKGIIENRLNYTVQGM
jgi:hypothetical protein